MASIVKRRKKFSVVYSYVDERGEKRQKWETFSTMADAKKRKAEIETQQEDGTFQIPTCTTLEKVFRVRDSLCHLIYTTLILNQLTLRSIVEIKCVTHLFTRFQDGLLIIHLGDLLLCLSYLQVGNQFASVEDGLSQLADRIPHELSGIRQLIAR